MQFILHICNPHNSLAGKGVGGYLALCSEGKGVRPGTLHLLLWLVQAFRILILHCVDASSLYYTAPITRSWVTLGPPEHIGL